MDDIRIRQGATLERTFKDTDVTAQTLTLTISNNSGIIESVTANYSVVASKAVATVSLQADYPIGEYEYMYTITYSDGFVAKLPNASLCKGSSCELPKLIICEANDEVDS